MQFDALTQSTGNDANITDRKLALFVIFHVRELQVGRKKFEKVCANSQGMVIWAGANDVACDAADIHRFVMKAG